MLLDTVPFPSAGWIWSVGLIFLNKYKFFRTIDIFLLVVFVQFYQFYECVQIFLALFLWLVHKDYEFCPKNTIV